MDLHLDVTEVFEWNWNAINAKNPDGTRKYRYIINEGSSRSSKTLSIIDCIDLYARTQKNKRLTVWRDTKTDCKKTVLTDAIRHFKNSNRYLKENFNKTESIFKYLNTDTTFEIHGTDDEDTVHGLNQDVAWFNEPYMIAKSVFDQVDQRTSDFIFIDWNPKKAHFIEDLKKDKRAIVIHSTFKNNKFCPIEQKNKILSYQPLSMCDAVTKHLISEDKLKASKFDGLNGDEIEEVLRCLENEFKKSASKYMWSVYGLGLKAEKPNRIFSWEEISLQEYLKIDKKPIIGTDWGSVDPWAIGEAKYSDGCLYVREHNYDSENIIRQKLSSTEKIQIGNPEDEGLVSWMFNKIGIKKNSKIICDTNRPTKIRALRSAGYEYAVAAPKPANSILDGIDLLNNLKVYFTSDSTNIRYEQENYSRQVDRFGNILEEPEDMDNHHMDWIRYVALFLQAEGVIKKV